MATKDISWLSYDSEFSGKMEPLSTMYKLADADTRKACSSKYSPYASADMNISSDLYQAMKYWSGTAEGDYMVAVGQKRVSAEIRTSDNTTTVMNIIRSNNSSGTFTVQAGYTQGEGQNLVITNNTYLLRSRTNRLGESTVLGLTCLMPFILEDDEASELFNSLTKFLTLSPESDEWETSSMCQPKYSSNLDEFGQLMAKFTNNVSSRMLESGDANFTAPIKMPAQNSRIVRFDLAYFKTKLTLVSGKAINFTDVEVRDNVEKAKTQATVPFTTEELETLYRLADKCDFSCDVQRLIPVFDPHWVYPKYVLECAYIRKMTAKSIHPVHTFYFVGPSGTGKTVACRIIAALLGSPYMKITCNGGMDLIDLIGTFYPRTGDKSGAISLSELRERFGLPDVEDILDNPASAFFELYGNDAQYTGQTEGQLIWKMINTVIARGLDELNADGNDYIFVESNFTKGVRVGALIEMQEVGSISKPYTLIGLNDIMESGADANMNLTTGEMLFKHPNTTIIFTSNDGYSGTKDLNQSVLSRLAYVLYFENPTPEKMAERVVCALPEFAKYKDYLKRMAETIPAANDYLAKNNITSGVCGQRELESWCSTALAFMAMEGESELNDSIVRRAAQPTVANKVAQNRDDIREVSLAVFDTRFGPCNIFTK